MGALHGLGGGCLMPPVLSAHGKGTDGVFGQVLARAQSAVFQLGTPNDFTGLQSTG